MIFGFMKERLEARKIELETLLGVRENVRCAKCGSDVTINLYDSVVYCMNPNCGHTERLEYV